MKNLTLGCDPEAFLTNMRGEFISSIGKIGGSKHAPLPLPIGDGFAVQEDNVALEFNIPPAHNAKEFVNSINKALYFLRTEMCMPQDLKISTLSAVKFPESELQDPAAQEFGCDPDYNAWTMKRNPRPKAGDPSLRSCGGHVHIGFDQSAASIYDVIRMCDLHMGVPSVLMDHGEMRKQLYGKAGAHRKTSFGCEYRTMSNFWIFDDRLITWVWNNTERAVSAAVERLEVSEEDQARIVNCINNNDKNMAEDLVAKYALEIV